MLSSKALRLCEPACWCSIALAALTSTSRPFREAHLLTTPASVGAVSVLCDMPVSAAATTKISAVPSKTFAKPAAIWRGPSGGRDQSAPQRQSCLPVCQSRYRIMILNLRRRDGFRRCFLGHGFRTIKMRTPLRAVPTVAHFGGDQIFKVTEVAPHQWAR